MSHTCDLVKKGKLRILYSTEWSLGVQANERKLRLEVLVNIDTEELMLLHSLMSILHCGHIK